MSECTLCPRRCGADRAVMAGVCHATDKIRVARAAPHYGEEPCISGEHGSGAVFFSGCPLGCVFCQNYLLSRARQGKEISVERLAEIFSGLENQGVHNINLVTGTPYVPQILQALDMARPRIPVVWNSSGYESQETLRRLDGKVQIYLPDLKYLSSEMAGKYSKAPDYPTVATAAIREMVRQTDGYMLDEDGMLQRGVVIRHLVLPGHAENTRKVIRWVEENFAPGEVMFSLMAQYTPCGAAEKFPEINRPLTEEEWSGALAALEDSAIADGFVQELSASGEEQIPDFTAGTGVGAFKV